MKKVFFLFLLLLSLTALFTSAATLKKISFSATQGIFEAKLLFDSIPSYSLDGVLGNTPSLSFTSSISENVPREISWGPINTSIVSTKGYVNISFKFSFVVSALASKKGNMLVIDFVPVGISQKLALSGAATKISIDFSGEKGSTLGLAVKYLARLLNRNIVIDPKIATKPINITLSNVTPSEAFYDVLASSSGVGYAILPDGTYYIAPVDSLTQELGKLGVGTYNNIVDFYNLSTTNVSSSDFTSLVSNLFGKNKVVGYIGTYAIVKATARQQKTVRSLMNFLKESTNFSTISWNSPESERDLENLITTMYPTVKVMYLPAFSTMVIKGSAPELEKARGIIEKYAQILSESGPKVTVTFNVPTQNIPAFLQFSKSMPAITAYGSPSKNSSNAIYIVSGPKKEILKFEENVRMLASTVTIAQAKTLHFSFVTWLDKNSVNDLVKMLSIVYPDVKTAYFPSFGQLLFYGYNPTDVDSAAAFVKNRRPLQTVKIKRSTVSVEIPAKNLPAVDALLKGEYPTLFGTGTTVSASMAKYVVSGESNMVEEFVNSLKNSGLISKKSTVTSNNATPTSVYLREVPWENSQSADDILKLLAIKYPNLKEIYLKSLREFVVYGTDYAMINDAARFLVSHQTKKEIKKVTEFVKIRAQDFETVKALISGKGMNFFGPTKPATMATEVTIAVSGSASEVGETLLEMKDSGLILSEKSPTKVSTTSTATVQIVVVHNGLVSCNVKNYPLSSLIERVYSEFGKNVVFSSQLPSVNLKLSNVSLEEFTNALKEAYSLSFNGTAVTVVEKNSAGLTRVYRTSDDANQIEKLASFVGGKTFVDQKRGMVIVSNLTPATAKELDSMVKPLLNSRKDVEIEAKIVDVSSNDGFTKNLDTTLMTPQLVFDNNLKFSLSVLKMANLPKFLTDFSNDLVSSSATLTGNFSETTGNASVLSAPVVTTQSGENANILIGSKYPYMVTTVSNGQQQQQLKFLDTGIQLTILPVILPNDRILLTITIEVSDADWAHAVNGIPAVNTRSASMKVVVSNGQTLMIGGLTKHSRSENVVKIPFLGDLPFIGQFFRHTTFQDSVSNLDIFITAKVRE